MSLGFVVVATAIGLFVLAPLALAWVSADARRWSRVEGVLGREPGERGARWIAGLWVGMGVAFAAMGVAQARTEEADGFPSLSLLLGAAYMANGVFNYVVYRRRRAAERSAKPQVEDRAEPRGPAAGG
jgi:heme A synthase